MNGIKLLNVQGKNLKLTNEIDISKGFQAIGALGPYILAIITAIYLYAQNRITYLQIFGLGLAINLAINFLIKSAIKQPRPKGDLSSSSTTDYEFGLTETGKRQGADRYGMPSGHAQTVGYILAFMSPIFTSTTTAVFHTCIGLRDMSLLPPQLCYNAWRIIITQFCKLVWV